MEENYIRKILAAELDESLLHKKQMEVDSLLEITRAINQNSSAKDLYQIYGFTLRAQMKIDRLIVFYHEDDNWECVHSMRIKKEQLKDIEVNPDWLKYREPIIGADYGLEFPLGLKTLFTVYHKNKPLAIVLTSELEGGLGEDQASKMIFIRTITNIVTVAIENKRLFKKQLSQVQMEKEMELASKMQNMLIPQSLPNDPALNISAIYIPHFNIGGDYYDVVRINENEILGCIADVSGKGISAALLMANFQALLRLLSKETNSLTKLVEKLNENVTEITQGERFITFFVARYNQATRKLCYINSGHPPPLIVSNSSKDIIRLKEGSTIIGAFDKLPKIEEKSITVPPNALMVMYTDGLTDLTNENGDFFDEPLLTDFLTEQTYSNSEFFNTALLERLSSFKNNEKFSDDISILSWKFD